MDSGGPPALSEKRFERAAFFLTFLFGLRITLFDQ